MVNKVLTRKIFRDLWHRKLIVTAVVFMIMVGVGSYFGMDAVYYDLNNAKNNYYQKYNLADFTLDIKRAPEEALAALNNLPNVLRLRSRVKTQSMVLLPEKSYQKRSHLVPGVIMSLPTPKRNIINNVKMISGMWFSGPNAREVIIDQQFAEARNLQIGDSIDVRLPDQQYKLLIVGTVMSPEFATILAPGNLAPDPGGYAIMFMPHQFLQQASELTGSFNQLLGMVDDNSSIAVKNTMTLLASKLDNYGVIAKTAQLDQIGAKVLSDELVNIKKTITFLPAMFFLVAVLILNVMINRLVTQQRTVIGTLKAIGYTNFAILRHYLAFGLLIGMVGGILGIFLGYGLEYLMLYGYKAYFALPNMATHFYPKVIVAGIIISILSALIGVLFGARKTIMIEPAEAMSPLVPKKSTHVFLERAKVFWGDLSFQSKMIGRAILRNKFRSLVTVFASMLATALVFSAMGFIDSIDKMINFSFDHTQHQDYTMTLREPLGKDILATTALLPGVKKIEGQLSVSAKLQNNPYEKTLEIIGLPSGHELFTPVDKEGKQIKTSASGLVINERLARILNVKEGDSIVIRPLIGNRMPAQAVITKIINTYLGLNAYADQQWLSRLLGDSYATNNILFKLVPDADQDKFMRAVYKFAPMVNLVSIAEAKALMVKTFNEFLVFSIIIMIVFAAVIAIGSIVNTAIISLNEGERDVASLRVLGYTNLQVGKIFFGESIILNSIGILLGLFLGVYFAYYMSVAFSTEVYRMPFVIKAHSLIKTVLIMYGFVIISQLLVFRVIKKLNWFDVLNVRA